MLVLNESLRGAYTTIKKAIVRCKDACRVKSKERVVREVRSKRVSSFSSRGQHRGSYF